jgi:iron(III) transport system permease protein
MSMMTRTGRVSARFSQQGVTLTILLVLLAILVLGPLLVLVRASFAPSGTTPFETGVFTLDNYRAMLASADTVNLVVNTVVYAIGSVSIAVALATAIAWLTERTDMPGQVLIRILMFSWMAVPPLVMGFGWILLINPGSGALNVWAKALFGTTQTIFTIYSIWSLIFITALAAVPTAYVMVSGLLRNIDPQLEQAGKVMGAGSWSIIRRITLPLLTPGILSVLIYMFMAVVQTFDLPLIIGLTARIPVLSTRVYLLSSPDRGLPNYGLSSSFGIFLLLLASLLMWGYLYATRIGERFRVVTGKGFRPRRLELRAWRYPALAGVMVYFAIMLLPVLMLFWASLFPVYRTPSFDLIANASFSSYARALGSSTVQRAALNTLILVVSSGTVVMLLASLIGWFSVRASKGVGRTIDILSFAPTAIPPVVMVVAILLLYLKTPLYGTIWLLVIGHATIYLAFGARTMVAAIMQIHKELMDAALISGASWFTGMRRIIFPLVWPHILNGWLWVMAHSARDLTIPLTLMTASNMVLSSALWMMWDFPDLPGAAAVSMLLICASLVVVVPLQVLAGRASAHRA